MEFGRTLRSPLSTPRTTRRPAAWRPALEALEERSLLSATVRIGVMGDSLSAAYAGMPYGAAGDHSWTEQLQTLRSKDVIIYNEAMPGATSGDVLSQGQATAVAQLAAQGKIDYAALMVGANDLDAHLTDIFTGNPVPFVQTVVANIETAADTVLAAGHVKLVIGDIPDISVTPAFQAAVGYNPYAEAAVSATIRAADDQIEAFAASQHIPVVDMFGLTHLTLSPITVGGVQVDNLYAPGGFHPNTVAQGLMANTILDALHTAYHAPTQQVRLTDQDLLSEAGIAHGPGHSYFDVQPFVLYHRQDDAGSEGSDGHAADCDARDHVFAGGVGAREESLLGMAAA